MKPQKTLDQRVEGYIKWGDWAKVKQAIDYMKDNKPQYPNLAQYQQIYDQHIAQVIRNRDREGMRK